MSSHCRVIHLFYRPFFQHAFLMEEIPMPNLVTRIRKGLPSIFTQGPPGPPAFTEAAQAIIDADEKAGRELTVQEIQDRLGLDNVTLAAVAPGIGIARARWATYQAALAEYQQKQAKRVAQKAGKSGRKQRLQAQPKDA